MNGDEPEFRGAVAPLADLHWPRPLPRLRLIGLEDELEGRWGRTEAELRDDVQSTARDMLDAWGDRTSHVHRLHSAARRHLLDAFANWASRYAELQRDGCWQVTGESTGKWHYSDEALSTFPRYRMDEAILVEVDRLRPSSFRTLAAPPCSSAGCRRRGAGRRAGVAPMAQGCPISAADGRPSKRP